MQCQLCGYEFDAVSKACHTGCPMGKHCNLICCPNCGYQVVDQSKSTIASLLERFLPGKKSQPIHEAHKGMIPLTHVPAGQTVTVGNLDEMSAGQLNKLSIFGLTPGGQVAVMQHNPSPVIRIDETELTISPEIMDRIWVNN